MKYLPPILYAMNKERSVSFLSRYCVDITMSFWYDHHMTIKHEPSALTAAKKIYGHGVWEPQFLLGKPDNDGKRKILGIDHDGPKTFWPYKKWSLIDGKWIPSIEMSD